MVKLWNSEVPKSEERYINASEDDDDNIFVFICDWRGEQVKNGLILTITNEGYLLLNKGISEKEAKAVGIKLDSEKRIQVSD